MNVTFLCRYFASISWELHGAAYVPEVYTTFEGHPWTTYQVFRYPVRGPKGESVAQHQICTQRSWALHWTCSAGARRKPPERQRAVQAPRTSRHQSPLCTAVCSEHHVRGTTARRRYQGCPSAGTPSATAHRATSTHGRCYLPLTDNHPRSYGPPEASARVGGSTFRGQLSVGPLGSPFSQEVPATKGNLQWNFA